MGKSGALVLGFLAFSLVLPCALAQNDCAANLVFKNTSPDPVILQTEINLMEEFRPFVTTYPFLDQNGREVLVVMAKKFPLSRNFPIMEIPTPQGFKERWKNFIGTWPKYYYFEREELADLIAAKDLAAVPVDFAHLNQARVILFPFIKFPILEDEDDRYRYEGKDLASLHRAYLRTIIEALHKIGFQSELGQLLHDWNSLLLNAKQDKSKEELIEELTSKAKDRLHSMYGVGVMRMIQQSFEIEDGLTYVWTNKESYRNPRSYLRKEQMRKLINDDPEFFSRALAEADYIGQRTKELEQQGHSEQEIEEILFPDPERRKLRQQLKAQLASKDFFRIDDP